jgi:hypothetical protein
MSINTISGLTNGYNSSYDVIYYFPDFNPASNTVSILNSWYDNNKGVVLGGDAGGLFTSSNSIMNLISSKITFINYTTTVSSGISTSYS